MKKFLKNAPPTGCSKMVIPSIMTVLVLIIYNMADIFYRTDGRPNQVAAICLTMPVCLFIFRIFGIGGSCVKVLAKDNAKRLELAVQLYGSIDYFGPSWCRILLGMEGILKIIGANEKTIDFAGLPFCIAVEAFYYFTTLLASKVRGR